MYDVKCSLWVMTQSAVPFKLHQSHYTPPVYNPLSHKYTHKTLNADVRQLNIFLTAFQQLSKIQKANFNANTQNSSHTSIFRDPGKTKNSLSAALAAD